MKEWMEKVEQLSETSSENAFRVCGTNAEEIEIFVNNESQGIRKVSKNHEPIRMNINYFIIM